MIHPRVFKQEAARRSKVHIKYLISVNLSKLESELSRLGVPKILIK